MKPIRSHRPRKERSGQLRLGHGIVFPAIVDHLGGQPNHSFRLVFAKIHHKTLPIRNRTLENEAIHWYILVSLIVGILDTVLSMVSNLATSGVGIIRTYLGARGVAHEDYPLLANTS